MTVDFCPQMTLHDIPKKSQIGVKIKFVDSQSLWPFVKVNMTSVTIKFLKENSNQEQMILPLWKPVWNVVRVPKKNSLIQTNIMPSK